MCKPNNSISFACVCVRQREDMCVKERVSGFEKESEKKRMGKVYACVSVRELTP